MAFINIRDKNTASDIIDEIERSENRDRRRNDWISYNCYSGRLRNFVEEELSRLLPQSFNEMSISDTSVTKLIVDKKSKSYQNQPIRTVEGDEEKSNNLEEIYKEGDAFRNLQEMDQTYNRSKYSLMWVNYRADDEKYQFMNLAPYEFNLIIDQDSGELDCVILNMPDSTVLNVAGAGDGVNTLIADDQADSASSTKVYAMWTREAHVIVKVQIEVFFQSGGQRAVNKSVTYVPIEGNPDNINPLGILPFVYIKKELAIDYPIPSPLHTQDINWNVMNSNLLTAASLQGYGQLVISAPEEMLAQMERLSSGWTTGIKIPQSNDPNAAPSNAQYINPNPDLSGQKDSYETYLRKILAEHGISSAQALREERFSSGLERLIAQADVQDQIEQNQNIYTVAEKQMFEIVKEWDRVLNTKQFKEDDELTVIFPKPKVLISDKETLENIQKRLDMGLIERWEALIILDPNLTEETARQKIEHIDTNKMESFQGFINGGSAKETEAES